MRLIIDPPSDGATQMATDEAILMAVARGEQPPTLRLYRWSPPCLSLGYGQPLSDIDRGRVAARGWGLVRRLTGGRAILHYDELTYSISLPADHPLAAGSIVTSYRRLSAALLEAMRRLGLPAAAEPSPDGVTLGAVCIEVPSNYEITSGGRKLIGSAQARKHGGVIQHGSLPLQGDPGLISEGLRFTNEVERAAAAERVRERATTIMASVGQVVGWERAAEAVIDSFAACFGITMQPAHLSEAERIALQTLRNSRYGSAAWTERF